jgi:hypothetical protein
MVTDLKDKDLKPIREGEKVWTPVRGGKREGVVEGIARTNAEAKKADVKHPPKAGNSELI